jgi:hypothetical protein
MQVFVQNNVLKRVLSGKGELKVPWVLRLISSFPLFQRLPAYFVGVGARPEHIQSPEMSEQQPQSSSRASEARPGIHNHDRRFSCTACGYGFRARRFAPPGMTS